METRVGRCSLKREEYVRAQGLFVIDVMRTLNKTNWKIGEECQT